MYRTWTRITAVSAITLLAACADTPTELTPTNIAPQHDVISQVYTSGSNVTTWNAIPELDQPAPGVNFDWNTKFCTVSPKVGLDANWQSPHNAFVVGHPWQNDYFQAPWINAWSNNGSSGGNPIAPSYNWTKYSTQVSGNGSFVIQLLADNCSWIYLDGTLVGRQTDDHSHLTYGLTLNGTHTLTFIIFDGGGASGGKYRLETTTNPPPPLNNDLDNDGHANADDAFPLNPAEWADTDHDGVGDNGDAFPSDPSETVDSDHDGVGDNSDAYPNDPTRTKFDTDSDGINDTVDNCPLIANASQADLDHDGLGDACDGDIDGDGVLNAADAFPTNPAESMDSDGDGIGNNGDVFPNDSHEWADGDHDGIGNNGDNCPVVSNANQADLDHDGIGDACDSDIDGDGVVNSADVYPRNPAEWADSDGDGIGDNADPYDNSYTGPDLSVGTCSTGAANRSMGGGTFFSDLIGAAYSSAPNHGAFVNSVAALATSWKKAGWITGRDEGAINSCAARTK